MTIFKDMKSTMITVGKYEIEYLPRTGVVIVTDSVTRDIACAVVDETKTISEAVQDAIAKTAEDSLLPRWR
ncbi:MAG: hypothetical protein MN733_27870 [Nitrososphaera sp.]|nr:hypothetical protein [Nitrososphaera sp.]